MRPFLKKDLLLFWRDRKEVLMSILLPIVLIVVLTYAYSGVFVFGDDQKEVSLNIAIVQEDDVANGLMRFEEKLETIGVEDAQKDAMLKQATDFSSRLQAFLNHPELQTWLSTKEMSESEAKELVKEKELDGLIKIAEGYTFDTLSAIFLGDDASTPLIIQVEKESMEVSILRQIIENYQRSINYQLALGEVASTADMAPVLPQGGIEKVNETTNEFTGNQYFTIAITTLIALFGASTVAMKTVTEKREMVFNRILLSNRNPLLYLSGKMSSTLLLTGIQFILTLTVTQLLLDVFPGFSFTDWLGIVILMALYAMFISGLSAVFVSISLKMEDPNGANAIFSMIVMGLGLLGGNFFPMDVFPNWLKAVGEWTPNGLIQVALRDWILYRSFDHLMTPMMIIAVLLIGCIICSLVLFPRKERV